MWLHLVTGNHNETGVASLGDMIEWLTTGLVESGHRVTVGDDIAPSAINVLWENFKAQGEAAFIENDFQFGLIATEIPTGDTFNWRDAPYWRERRRTFDRIAPRASFIWSTVEATVPDYAPFAPSSYLELGYSKSLVDPVFAAPPTADFGFYGVLNEYREGVLAKLRRRCQVVVPDEFLAPSEVNPFLASLRVGICFKQSEEWPILSPTRVGRLLHAKRGVAAERVPVATRQTNFIPVAEPGEDFVDFCFRVLEGWKPRADEAFERFRKEMPMSEIVARMMDETIAGNARLGGGRSRKSRDDGDRLKVGFDPVAVLVEERGSYNILRAAGRYIAVDRKLGSVPLFAELLGARPLGEVILAGSTLKDLREEVDAIDARWRPVEVDLVEETDAFNIVRVGDGYAALAKTLGQVALMHEPIGAREIGEEIVLEPDLEHLRTRVADIERRNRARSVRLVEETPEYNIVEADDLVLAISKRLGPTTPFQERIGEREITDLLLRDWDFVTMRSRVAVIEAASARPVATLIEETSAYNIVESGGKFVAIAKRLGPTTLFSEVLGSRDIEDLVLTGPDLDAVRAKALEAQGRVGSPVISFTEETCQYNIVKAGDEYIALDKSLGQLTLFKDRLGDRELGALILKDSNLKTLQARVAATERSR